MRPTFLITLLATLALFCSIARGGDEKKHRYEATTLNAGLPKSQPTKTVFATVRVTGEVGED